MDGGVSRVNLTIPDGTMLHLVLMDDVQGKKMKVGDQVRFKVREDIVIEHQTLVRTGSEAIGHITLSNKNGFAGKSGKINIRVDFVNATDGTHIRLRGDPDIAGGRQRAVTAAAVAEYGPGALFIRGWDARIPVGTMLNAYVDGDMHLNMANFGVVPAAPVAPVSSQIASIQATLIIESTPPGGEVEIDGSFVGNTPSTITSLPGIHQVTVKKKGFTDWTKKLNVTGGAVHLNAELEQVSTQTPVPVPPPPPPPPSN
jgi:hypothetical protein